MDSAPFEHHANLPGVAKASNPIIEPFEVGPLPALTACGEDRLGLFVVVGPYEDAVGVRGVEEALADAHVCDRVGRG